MPAVTLGLAEVEERLAGIRRRLNRVTLLHVIFAGASVVCLVGALLVVVGLRGNVESFRIATWSGLAIVIATIVTCALLVRRRWLDLAQTAALVDRRGQLTDRLTTLVDLQQRPRNSRLAPLLIAQTLSLGDRWRVQRIVPRRLPRSLVLLIASLLALSAAPLVDPSRPAAAPQPVAPPPQQQAPHTDPPRKPAGAPPPPGASLAVAGIAGTTGTAGDARGTAGESGDAADPPAAAQPGDDTVAAPRNAAAGTGDSAPPAASAGERLAALPDRWREALRTTLQGERAPLPQPSDTARTAGAAAPRPGEDTRDARRNERADSQRPSPGTDPSTTGTPDSAAPPQRGDTGAGGSPAGPRPDQGGSPPKSGGSGAGTGSDPESLLGAASPTGAPAAEAGARGVPTTFKLNITSFLRSNETHGGPPRGTAKPGGTGGGAGGTAPMDDGPMPALHEQQQHDDPLRKADVPPEYEDLVRRVYTARALDAVPVGPPSTTAGSPAKDTTSKGGRRR